MVTSSANCERVANGEWGRRQFAIRRSPFARALAPAYPPAVAFVIFATANHYVLDAVAGAALGLAGLRLSRALE